MAPYWSVLWRSGQALAREVAELDLAARRVVELGCGLGLPSLAAARAGARVLATDRHAEPLALLAENAARNGLAVETAVADFSAPDELVARGPFDLVLAADVLYERQSVAPLVALLPRLAPEAWVADPGRAPAKRFLELLADAQVAERIRGVVVLHRLRFASRSPVSS